MSKKKWNVLIFPGGMENGLEIQKALKYTKEIQLFSASSGVENHAHYVYETNFIVRDVREKGWVDDLNKVVLENKIDLIYPANSLVIDHLNAARDEIKAPILLPNSDILYITRSKKNTIKILKDVIPAPAVYKSINEVRSYPVFAKPDMGYGAQGAIKIDNEDEIKTIDFDSYIVQEYLPGDEYTVDCFSDHKGELLFSGARKRSRVRMGTSMHADSADIETETTLRDYAKKILKKIPIKGAWFFQVKQDVRGDFRLLEIDVRIAGTMCFNRVRGINFPLLSIFQYMGINITPMVNVVPISLDRCLKNRYILKYQYNTVYVDLDDTLIVHEKLNLELVQFLFQCINNKKKIILITKYKGSDLNLYLATWRVFQLFDSVIWLKEMDSKADYISDKKSIFIDDSFSQRQEVVERHGIPTFDTSMVEGLLDDRL